MAPATWRLVARWAARTVSVLLVGLVLSAVAVLIVIPRATHGTALTVLTGSMTPGIPVGSVVIDRPVDPGTLHVGDVATYQRTPGQAEYITHRIVKIDTSKSPTEFTFKGDANRGPDISPVPATAIRGKVWFHVPYLGGIRDAIQTKGGLAGVGIVLLAGYALFQLASAYKDRRDANVPDAPTGEGPAPVAEASVAADDLALVRRRLAVLTSLAPNDVERLSSASLLRLISSAFLDVDDATFVARVAEESSVGPHRTDGDVTADHNQVGPAGVAPLRPWARYALPLCAVPRDAATAETAPLFPPPTYSPPQYAVPCPAAVAPAQRSEADPASLPDVTPLDVLRRVSDRTAQVPNPVPDVDDVRPAPWGDLAQEASAYLREEHARV